MGGCASSCSPSGLASRRHAQLKDQSAAELKHQSAAELRGRLDADV